MREEEGELSRKISKYQSIKDRLLNGVDKNNIVFYGG